MKKLILLLTLAFMMCGCKESVLSNHRDTNIDYIKDGFQITIIDSCEYIRYANGHGPEFTHKGNCKFCQKRLENTIDSIIKNNK